MVKTLKTINLISHSNFREFTRVSRVVTYRVPTRNDGGMFFVTIWAVDLFFPALRNSAIVQSSTEDEQ